MRNFRVENLEKRIEQLRLQEVTVVGKIKTFDCKK